MNNTWIARVSGLEDWPRSIVVKAESESDAMEAVLSWLTRKRLQRSDGSDDEGYRGFSPQDVEVEEALNLEEQQEIDEWLEGKGFDLWRSFVNETRE